ncbi:MAG: hypothetical protein ABFS19_03620 [Thermodesulfobacteriota bacterium]
MKNKIVRFKPGVRRETHLLFAAALWTLIGIRLMGRGLFFLVNHEGYWLIFFGFLLGSVKSYLILDKTALKGIERILKFNDNTCLGAVYSRRTWMLVLLMISGSILLRRFAVMPNMISVISVGIGWALFFSSRFAWRSWLECKKSEQSK